MSPTKAESTRNVAGIDGFAWYVARALRETGPQFRRARRTRSGVCLVVGLLALALAACGGGTRQDVNEPSGKFPVKIVTSNFPTRQRLAQTSLLRLGVQNTGSKPVPALAITI